MSAILNEPMKLREALLLANAPDEGIARTYHLICGFTPLHLSTFLCAHLRRRAAGAPVVLDTGLYGDLYGNMSRVPGDSHGVAIVLEWFDLDPRLGARGSGRWDVSSIAASVSSALDRLGLLLADLEERCPSVVLSGPTLPPLPVFHTGSIEAGAMQLRLEARMAGFLAHTAARGRTRVLAREPLDRLSPHAERYDAKLHLEADFPYKRVHASTLADHLAEVLLPASSRKGIISDLDNTLWDGILGEVGVDGIGWSLASHAQVHGLYQQLLSSLADAGILIAIASKNDPALVARAFERKDLILESSQVYPIAAGWGVKSESVQRILSTWNILAKDAVFVDDSLLELEEVARAHPGIECVRFPSGAGAADVFLRELRDRFSRSTILVEDKLRAASIRTNEFFHGDAAGAADAFLESIGSSVLLDFTCNPGDERALELVNKTNQFNLNGVRYTAAEWKHLLARPGAFMLTVTYADKFGSLGKIAVLAGTCTGQTLAVDVWVLSCRAFTRRIEHQCLKAVFDIAPEAGEVRLAFRETARNGPFRDFAAAFSEGTCLSIAREVFRRDCPPLFHSVEIVGSQPTHV